MRRLVLFVFLVMVGAFICSIKADRLIVGKVEQFIQNECGREAITVLLLLQLESFRTLQIKFCGFPS